MPYIITTTRPLYFGPVKSADYEFKSRRAVATLEEAREWTYAARMAGEVQVPWEITESGGTVGPLPDGTVIHVTFRTYADIRVAANLLGGLTDAEQIDAYNAAQS